MERKKEETRDYCSRMDGSRVCLIGICMAAYLGSWVLKQDPGPDKMNSISIKIQQAPRRSS